MKVIIIFTIIISLINAYHLNIKSYKLSPSINYRYNCNIYRRYATTSDESNNQDELSKQSKPKQENVELFAAANRKSPIISKVGTVSQSDIKYSTEQSRTTSTTVFSSNITDLSTGSSTKLRNDLIGKQAELLRIEAEKEQILIDNERISQEKILLISIDECLLQLLNETITINDVVMTRKELLNKELFFRMIELINAEIDQKKKKKLFSLYDSIMEAIDLVDHSLFIDINASIQKEIKLENSKTQTANSLRLKSSQENIYNGTDQAYDEILKQWMSQIDTVNDRRLISNNTSEIDDTTTTSILKSTSILSQEEIRNMMLNGSTSVNLGDAFTGRAMLRFPAAMPLNMMPLILRSKEIPSTDLDIIRNTIFTSDILNQTIFDGSNYLTTIRGIPTLSAQDTFEKANQRLADFPSINERVRLFMLPEYRIPPKSLNVQIEKYSGSSYEPIFVLISKEAQPKPPTGLENAGAAIALIATLVTTFIYATDVNSFNTNFVQQALAGDETVVNRVLYITFGVLLVQCLHDLGHYAAASIHRTKLSFPPIYLPSLQIGLFGSITRFLSFPKNRKELFDVSIAGPVSGFIASIISTLLGLSYTSIATAEELASYPALPSGFFKISFLINELVDKYLHISQLPDVNTLVSIHPLLAVGIVGLIVNAFNFMPIGRLDGGRVVMAIAGRSSANGVAFAALIAQGVSLLTASSPISLYWILAVVILQRGADLPPIDDITPISTDEDDKNKNISWFLRASALLFCVLLTAGILLPVPTDLSTIANDVSNIASSPSSLQVVEPSIIPPSQWI